MLAWPQAHLGRHRGACLGRPFPSGLHARLVAAQKCLLCAGASVPELQGSLHCLCMQVGLKAPPLLVYTCPCEDRAAASHSSSRVKTRPRPRTQISTQYSSRWAGTLQRQHTSTQRRVMSMEVVDRLAARQTRRMPHSGRALRRLAPSALAPPKAAPAAGQRRRRRRRTLQRSTGSQDSQTGERVSPHRPAPPARSPARRCRPRPHGSRPGARAAPTLALRPQVPPRPSRPPREQHRSLDTRDRTLLKGCAYWLAWQPGRCRRRAAPGR